MENVPLQTADEYRARLEELRPAHEAFGFIEMMLGLHDEGVIDIEGGHLFASGEVEFNAADEAVLGEILA